jgi:dipeptide transport system ATP-binding protein
MAVVAETVERVVVMYAGQVVEKQSVDGIFSSPWHPYTAALLDALPERSLGKPRLPTISGVVPGRYDHIAGCIFNPRCQYAAAKCKARAPHLRAKGDGAVRCYFPLNR